MQAIASARSGLPVSGRPSSPRRSPTRLDVAGRDGGQDEVLLPRHAHVLAELRGEFRDCDQLLAGGQADLHRHSDRDEAVLLLRLNADVIGDRRRGVELEVGERVAEPPLDLGAHALRPEVVDHELDPRLHARDAVLQVFLPGIEQGAQHGQGLVDPDEDAEVAGQPRHRREAASDQHAEAGLTVSDRADEGDAVDLRRVAAVGAGGDGDLVLARKIGVVGVAVEELRHRLGDGDDVEQLVVREPCDRASGHVPDGVAAGSHGRQPDLVEPAEHLRQRGELEVVELNRLPRRELARALPVQQRELADGLQLRGCHSAGGQLDPEHERPDLRLVVVEPPPLEPDEIFLRHLLVARRDQRGQLAEHAERVLLALDPLDRVALQDEFERRRFLLGSSACDPGLAHVLTCLPLPPETAKAPDSFRRPRSPRRRRGVHVPIFRSPVPEVPAHAGWST